MAQDGSAAVFVVEEFSQKNMDRRSERVQCEVAHVLRKCECGEGNTEGEMCEGGLWDYFSIRTWNVLRRTQHAHINSYPRRKHNDGKSVKKFPTCIQA